MRWKWAIFAVLAILSGPIPPAKAWDNDGHEVIAALAARRLPDSQRRGLVDLLRHHPHYHEFFNQNPRGLDARELEEYLLARAATWPDWVRPERAGEGAKPRRITRYHHELWHFVNLPFIQPGEADRFDITRLRPSKHPRQGEESILQALPAALAILDHREGELMGAEASVARQIRLNVEEDTTDLPPAVRELATRAVAFSWVLHLVGDLHQPLHCSALYSCRYPDRWKHGDQGGNAEAVRTSHGVVRLHRLWDSLLDVHNSHPAAILNAAGQIEEKERSERDHAMPRSGHPTSEVQLWAHESFELAVQWAYLEGKLPTASYTAWETHQITTEQVPELPPDYLRNARHIAEQQASLAGKRLAALLRDVPLN